MTSSEALWIESSFLPVASPSIPRAYAKDEQDDAAPLVAAVSPLTDVQTLDLASSNSQQQQVALNLAFNVTAAGLNAEAQAFLNYAHNLQQQFNTITPDVFANSYSTGSMFGFQVGRS